MFRQITLREFFETTYRPARLLGRSAGTVEQYHVALRHAARCRGRQPLLTELSDELVQDVLRWQIEQGCSNATANKTRRHLLAIWRLARQQRRLLEEPTIAPLPEDRHDPTAWTVEEIGRILGAAAALPGEVCQGIPASCWWPALILTVYDTGLRITAAMSLEWDDLDRDRGTVLARASTQKQRRDQRLPLSAQTLRAVVRLRGPWRPIFPWPFDDCGRNWPTLNRYLRRLLQSAGLPSTRKDLWHKLRRSNASYIEAAGGNPTRQLGHSTPRVTANYLDPQITQPTRQVDLLPRPRF